MPFAIKPSSIIHLLIFSFTCLLLLSLLSVSHQDQKMQEVTILNSRSQKQSKLSILEQNLGQDAKFDPTFEPWQSDSITYHPVSSQLLYAEASINDNSTECVPIGFGYTKEESDELFNPEASYPDCSLQTPATLKVVKGNLVKTCENFEYSLGKPAQEELFGRAEYKLKWKTLDKDQVDTKDREYVFVKCGERREAAVFLKRREEAVRRAKDLTEKIRDEFKVKGDHRPLTVFMLVFDSLSRKHMFRSLPQTMSFLNATVGSGNYSNHFTMYDFLINHGHGENTIPNMIPYLFGYSFKYHKQRMGTRTHLNPEDSDFFIEIQKTSIWKQFEKMGFLTMFGFDIIWDFLVPAVGREIKTDHVFTNFWKGASKVFGTDNYINEQACFGSQDSHRYMLDYASSYLQEYSGINRFGYIHITTAHEKSGTIIKTVDDDLLLFMQSTLEFYQKKNEDIVFILAGDHGKHVSETDYVKPGWLENLLPAQIVITNKDLMRRLNSDDIMRTNTQRLVSRPDWHLTLKHLSLVPYGQIKKSSPVYNQWKTVTDSDFSISLLLEKVPSSRTCSDVDIEDYFCVCGSYEEISIRDVDQDLYIKHLVNFAFESTINTKKHEFCRNLSFDSIKYAAVRDLDEGLKIYRLRVGVKENKNVVIEIFASVFLGRYEEKFRKEDFGGMAVRSVPGNLKKPEKMQLLKIVRIDEYAGYMEEFSVAIGQKPTFCVPVLPEELGEKEFENEELTGTLEKMVQDLVLRVAEGNNCFEECRRYDQICQPWGIQIMSNPGILKKTWRGSDELVLLKGKDRILVDLARYGEKISSFLGIVNQTVNYARSGWSCHTLIASAKLFCPCKV